MYKHAVVPSCYRMGGKRKGGVRLRSAKIVFATAGLAVKWYASDGCEFLEWYGGVFFDEVADAERDPEYSLLWTVAHRVSRRRDHSLKLVAGSATLSDRMMKIFSSLDAQRVECHVRPFPIQRYVSIRVRSHFSMLCHGGILTQPGASTNPLMLLSTLHPSPTPPAAPAKPSED